MHPDLARIVEAVRFLEDDQVAIGAETHALASADPSAEARAAELAELIYRHLYVRSPGEAATVLDVLSIRDFQALLSEANPCRGCWEPGWQLVEPGRRGPLVVRSPQGLVFWADAHQVRTGRSHDEAACEVRVPTEYRRLLPGFYLFTGASGRREEHHDGPVTRVYWHLASSAAPTFVAAVCDAFDAASIPFHAKVLDDPRGYRRADAGVLYLAKSDFPVAGDALRRSHLALRDHLRASAPLLTRPLAPGLAIAEDPGDGHSFGEHRCGLVATALWRARRSGRLSAVDRLRAVESTFRDAGLDPDAPHLSPGSRDEFYTAVWSGFAGSDRDLGRATPPPGRAAAVDPGSTLLEAASALGRALCGQAVWSVDHRRCTWVGRANPVGMPDGAPVQPRVATLGPDLYAGLGGVALFLAELFARTGDPSFREHALGALRLAVHKTVSDGGAGPGHGLFAGPPGIAFAARVVAARVGEDLSPELVRAVLAPHRGTVGRSDDVMGGHAGAVLALLTLTGRPGWGQAASAAESWGRRLVGSEIGSGAALARVGDTGGGVPLTGLAHGAAGIGVALLGLYAASGQDAFLEAGRRAFAYEDALFDPRAGNWPDLRRGRNTPRPSGTGRFMVAWCHGAPGIALCRLRAAALDADRRDEHLALARVALDTTLRHLDRAPALDSSDSTLCHGLGGLAEALWVGHQSLGERRYGDAAVAFSEQLAGQLLAGRPLVSGTVCGGPNPSLMLGAAGLGHLLLRVSDPAATRSVLLPDPSA